MPLAETLIGRKLIKIIGRARDGSVESAMDDLLCRSRQPQGSNYSFSPPALRAWGTARLARRGVAERTKSGALDDPVLLT
jgi:hypothetical protein